MLRINQINKLISPENISFEQKLDDHYQKLFWAFFLPSFSSNRLSPEELENARSLARSMHAKRLDSLYVSHLSEEPLFEMPREEVKSTIRLAEARLSMEEAVSTEPPDPERLQELQWLLEAIADDERKKVVFSKGSIDRLHKNADILQWIAWLREIFERQEKENRELAERELRRQQPQDEEASQKKWRIKYRLVCVSHSVRQKPLNLWNGVADWIKLRAGDKKKRELFIEIHLPKAVPVGALWHGAYGETRRFLLALNIGSMGFFWWYALNQENKFYESIFDVENNANIEIREQNKYLYIDWGQQALVERDIGNVALCYRFLPGPGASESEQRPFGEYLTALAFLAKTDMHLNLTANACGLFFQSLKDAMKLYGDMSEDEEFSDAFDRNVAWVIKDEDDRAEFIELSKLLEHADKDGDFSTLTLDKVLQTKIICDAYLTSKFQQMADEEQGNSPTDITA